MGKEINYDEFLNVWADAVFAKADKVKNERLYEDSGSWKDGYLKGLNEGYIMAITMLTTMEKKAKKELNKDVVLKLFEELERNEQEEFEWGQD